MKRLFFALVLSTYVFMVHAEIQVQVNPSPVTINETFQLTLTQSDAQAGGVPDLSVLQKEFIILGTARQVNYSVINGQSTSTSQWVVTLKPLKTGVLSIPAIKMGAESSAPMTINVEAAGTKQDNSDFDQQDLLLKTSVNQDRPYVNQEIIYTVKIYNSKRLLDADYEAPKADNGLIIPLGDTKQYQTVQNNTSYVVEEQKYAVFPQKSGEFTISSPSFTALVYGFDPQRVKVSDKATKLTIQPIPPQYQGAWLPAKKVSLSEEYENANQSLSQGSTLVRTVVVEGTGIPAQLLPSLDFKNSDAFSVYPEKGTDRNQIKQDELVGRTEFKVTYLFNKPGKIIIPELKLTWFNTTTGKEEIAILAPRSLDITPSLTTNSSQTPTTSQVPTTTAANKAESLPVGSLPVKDTSYWPWLLALFFAAAWLITLGLAWWKKPRGTRRKHTEKKALESLKEACTSGNPQAARDALLKWASINWPDVALLNLNQLAQLTHDSQLKKQIQLLSQALYKKHNHTWRGEELCQAVLALKANKTGWTGKTTVLPPINPL
ncbi:BatD family protein [Legionella sp. km772]|uniref:BatD family protein n=1 Tax=Legionella sp. km772 TaxID=2498111 RepID=UPI000F8C47F0|nr:BatD family protein [Legionella sp. km772]RUR13833.1 protein BatD [Legionella sp. km772]